MLCLWYWNYATGCPLKTMKRCTGANKVMIFKCRGMKGISKSIALILNFCTERIINGTHTPHHHTTTTAVVCIGPRGDDNIQRRSIGLARNMIYLVFMFMLLI
jgi:hypothetical protein